MGGCGEKYSRLFWPLSFSENFSLAYMINSWVNAYRFDVSLAIARPNPSRAAAVQHEKKMFRAMYYHLRDGSSGTYQYDG